MAAADLEESVAGAALAVLMLPHRRSADSPAAATVVARGKGVAWRTVVRGLGLAIAFAALAITLAWLVVLWGILPRIAHWRPALEARASAALGVPVHVGMIAVTDDAIGPRWSRTIELRDVVIDEAAAAGHPAHTALRVARVRGVLTPATLLPGWDGRWRLRFERLLIEGAFAELRRDADGTLHVGGVAVGTGGASDGAAADWLFSQHQIDVQGASVVWIDALRGAPPLVLGALDAQLRNRARRHELQLHATPPSAWGGRLALRGDFDQPVLASPSIARQSPLGRPGDWHRWRGRLRLELPQVDLAPLGAYVTLPAQPTSGRGALAAWLHVRDGGVIGAGAELALDDVVIGWPDAPQAPLALPHLAGRLELRRDAPAAGSTGGALQARALTFTTDDGLVWPTGDAGLSWRRDASGRLASVSLQADRLDLAVFDAVLQKVPEHAWDEGAKLRDAMRDWRPQGIATQVEVAWSQAAESAEPRYRLKAHVAGLALAASAAQQAQAPGASASSPGRPGLQGADVELDATERGGTAQVAMRDGVLDFPGVFEQPSVPMQSLDAAVSWRAEAKAALGQPGALEVRVRDLRFANADAQGRLDAVWRSGSAGAAGAAGAETQRFPGHLELDGALERADASRVARYLPLQLPQGARRYVAHAVQAGRADSVTFRVHGDLARFPFASASDEGEFRIAARLADVRLAYLPEPRDDGLAWPAFDQVAGDLLFDGQRMALRGLHGRVAGIGQGGLRVANVRGAIANLRQPVLEIDGNGSGPLADALAFIDTSPVGAWLGGVLSQAKAQGPTQAPLQLALALKTPLHDGDPEPHAKPSVHGSVILAGNDLRLKPALPLLAAAKARIAFTEHDLAVSAASARMLGGEVAGEGRRQADGSVHVALRGNASAEGLRRLGHGDMAGVARLAAPLNGQANYTLALDWSGGRLQAALDSDLIGLGIDLPEPLRKAAGKPLPLHVRLVPLRDESALPRESLEVALGAPERPLLRGQWLRERRGDGGARVVRGGFGVFEAAPQPAAGVAARLRLAQLDVDAWRAALDRLTPGAHAQPRADNDAARATPPNDMSIWGSAYLPSTIALDADELQLGGRHFHTVSAEASRGTGAERAPWRVNVRAAELAGYAEYHPAGVQGAQGAGRVVARLSRLALPDGDEPAAADAAAAGYNAPTRLPALDIVVDRFELGGHDLGRAEVVARNADVEGAAGWQLERLRLTTPQARLEAHGEWALPARTGGRRRTLLDFTLDVDDGGALLKRLGRPGVLRGGKGRLAGQVGWQGSPLAIDDASLSGKLQATFERGQFLHADPGITKLLGVLSLQALPRRLLLDFHDVFGKGFAFDHLTGAADIDNGVATTRDLRMRGVQAVVLMEGSADLAHETQDLHVWVVPEVHAGAASLAVAAINPALGLGSFLAQWLLRRPLALAGTREFRITGPWAAPDVQRVERGMADEVPGLHDADGPDKQKESR